jgi:hypothetical protein
MSQCSGEAGGRLSAAADDEHHLWSCCMAAKAQACVCCAVSPAIGIVCADGHVLALHVLREAPKVEGIAAAVCADGHTLTMVADTDDPDVASQLLGLQLPWR